MKRGETQAYCTSTGPLAPGHLVHGQPLRVCLSPPLCGRVLTLGRIGAVTVTSKGSTSPSELSTPIQPLRLATTSESHSYTATGEPRLHACVCLIVRVNVIFATSASHRQHRITNINVTNTASW